jgi:UDP-N-acetylglucosamine 2-epimerase (non-hydrolysing)
LPRRDFHILVTCHRRENWSDGLDRIAEALLTLTGEGASIDVVLHPNPTVTGAMWRLFGDRPGIRLLAPMSHSAMIQAMRRADLLLSDSGGMQEEAPALGIPLLILRDKTERPEGLACGSMELVGNDPERIMAAVRELRRDPRKLAAMSRPAMPFGDGRAAQRIAVHCLDFLEERQPGQVALSA